MAVPQLPDGWNEPHHPADPVAVLKDRGVDAPADLPPAVAREFARVVSLLWLDGRVLPLDRFHIDPSDEGLLFGRGAWESTRTVDGAPWLWPLHLDRLRRTAELLCIDLDPARLPDADAVRDYVRALTSQDVVIRLNVTAGRPGKPGLVWMTAAPRAEPPESVRLKTVRNPVQKGQAYLTLKTFQYATRLRLGQQAARAGFDTALLLDADGNVQEAAHANVFVRLPDGWATPPADGGLLPGTVRHHVLSASPLPVRERPIPSSALAEVREAFVTNSSVGLVPVSRIDDRPLPIGDETRAMLRRLNPPDPPGVQYLFRERTATRR
jgi:branched-subunit amino acid aminotransferase/4-amino-4-deoxychorismate lyase